MDNGISWELLDTGVSTRLLSISCIDENTCIAVGEDGTCINTVNGGENWSSLVTGRTVDLKDIFCTSQEGVCYIVMRNQKEILKSNDKGQNWTVIQSPGDDVVVSIYCEDGENCYIVQNYPATISKTTNGGNSWTKLFENSSFGTEFYSLVCTSAGNECVVSGENGNIYYSTDSWSNWGSTRVHDYGTSPFINCNVHIGACIAVGSKGGIFRTTNMGASWDEISQLNLSSKYRTIECFTEDNACYMLGTGFTAKSTDGGKTWSELIDFNTRNMSDISCSSSSNCIVVGYGGAIAKTVDGGTTWSAQISGTTVFLYSIECDSSGLICNVGGTSGILHTENGGETWEKASGDQSATIFDIECIFGKNICYAVGLYDVIEKSTDGGKSWSISRAINQSSIDLTNTISCLNDASTCLVFSQKIIKTSDGGKTWNEVNQNIVDYFPLTENKIAHCIPESKACVAIANETNADIVITNDFGDTWEVLIPNAIFSGIDTLFCFDESRCLTVDINGLIAEFNID